MADVSIKRARAVFDAVVDLPPQARRLVLDSHCDSDNDLRSVVEDLLACHDRGLAEFLDPAAVRDWSGEASLEPARLPRRIGSYEVLRVLGEGGMGVVYEARQEHPSRIVALKVIRPERASRALLARFHYEAELLGRLQHPGIAHIYEASTAEMRFESGISVPTPFFAMELIQGPQLRSYVEQRGSDLPEKLELLARICDAVGYAHQRGVIHRDLKPSNIIVDLKGQPKIFDFGVARVIDASVPTLTSQTSAGELLGTIAYMSPEQLAGDARAADTRSDVYALGVIAYELLTGRPPMDIANQPLPRAIRTLSESEPPRASTIRPELRTDIDAILAKALQKSPDRRYASAGDLAADLRRYLRHEPISARPATTIYQLRKFARRNRILVGSVSVVLAVLAGATFWTSWALLEARRASDRAVAINAFLEEILATTDPVTGRADVKLVEVLRGAADEAATRFAGYPELEGDVRHLLGRAFCNLSLFEEALTHERRAHELRHSTLGPGDPATLEAGGLYAWLLYTLRRLDEATTVGEELLADTPSRLASSAQVLHIRRTLASVWMTRGEFDQAESELRSVLRSARASLGEDHAFTVEAINSLAHFLWVRAVRGKSADRRADLEEAVALLREVLDGHVRVHGEDGLGSLHAMNNLARDLEDLARYEEAAPYAQRVLELAPARYGEDHELCSDAAYTLAHIRMGQRRFGEAGAYIVRSIEVLRRQADGKDNPRSLSNMSDGLPILDAANRWEEGEAWSRILYERFRDMGGHGASLPLRYEAHLARFISRQGRLQEADEHFQHVLSLERDLDDVNLRARIALAYGGHLAACGRFEEAEQRLLSAKEGFAEGSWLFLVVHQELVRLYEAWGKPDKAAAWSAVLRPPAILETFDAADREQ